MGMGISNSSEFEKEMRDLGIVIPEIESTPEDTRLPSEVKVIPIEHGRGNKVETPEVIRKLIAEESIAGAPAKELISEFKVSQSSVSAYKAGATSTATINQPDRELKKHVDLTKLKIRNGARSKLEAALEALTPEKIESAKVRDIAAIAKDMSAIMKDQEETSRSDGPDVQVVVFQPRMKEEQEFETVVVHEQ